MSACLACTTIHAACQSCTPTGCQICDTANNWSPFNGTCQCQTGFYFDVSSQTCILCTTLNPLCTICNQISTINSCTACTTGSYASGTSCLTCSSAFNGCQQCTNDGSSCTVCDSSLFLQVNGTQCSCQSGYAQNSTLQCIACSTMDPLCATCYDNSGILACLSCNSGYYTLGPNCLLCNVSILGCLDCSSDGSACNVCDPAMNMQAVTGQCVCQLGFYQSSVNQLCVPCSTIDPLCASCVDSSGTLSCLSCSTGYFPVGNVCTACNTTITGCSSCDPTGTICSACDSAFNFQLSGSNCSCTIGFFFNATTQSCFSCSLIDPSCNNCSENSGFLTCLACLTGYYTNGTSCLLCDSLIPGCVDCNPSGTVCNSCSSPLHLTLVNQSCLCSQGYFINTTLNLCSSCSNMDPLCLTCENQAT